MNISDESPMHRIYWAYHTNNKIFNYVNGYNLTKTNVYLFAIKVSVRKNCDSALLWLTVCDNSITYTYLHSINKAHSILFFMESIGAVNGIIITLVLSVVNEEEMNAICFD